jgi:uncharacterized membrane protein
MIGHILLVSSIVSIIMFLFSVALVFDQIKKMKVINFWYTFFIDAISPVKTFFMLVLPSIYLVWRFK